MGGAPKATRGTLGGRAVLFSMKCGFVVAILIKKPEAAMGPRSDDKGGVSDPRVNQSGAVGRRAYGVSAEVLSGRKRQCSRCHHGGGHAKGRDNRARG